MRYLLSILLLIPTLASAYVVNPPGAPSSWSKEAQARYWDILTEANKRADDHLLLKLDSNVFIHLPHSSRTHLNISKHFNATTGEPVTEEGQNIYIEYFDIYALAYASDRITEFPQLTRIIADCNSVILADYLASNNATNLAYSIAKSSLAFNAGLSVDYCNKLILRESLAEFLIKEFLVSEIVERVTGGVDLYSARLGTDFAHYSTRYQYLYSFVAVRGECLASDLLADKNPNPSILKIIQTSSAIETEIGEGTRDECMTELELLNRDGYILTTHHSNPYYQFRR